MARIISFEPNKVVIATKDNEITLTCEPPNHFDEEIISKIWENIDE